MSQVPDSDAQQAGVFELTIGSGGPGRLGCADATGSKILWKPLVDKSCCVIRSMEMFGLDCMFL